MKMDRKLLSDQNHEIRYLARKLRVPQQVIRDAHKKIGRSRAAVRAYVLGLKAGLSNGS
jgi:hypothetical protein